MKMRTLLFEAVDRAQDISHATVGVDAAFVKTAVACEPFGLDPKPEKPLVSDDGLQVGGFGDHDPVRRETGGDGDRSQAGCLLIGDQRDPHIAR